MKLTKDESFKKVVNSSLITVTCQRQFDYRDEEVPANKIQT